MKSASELERELCEECPIYGQTGCDHCFEDALQYVIGMLEQGSTTKNNLGDDCISKQAVLNNLLERLKDYKTKKPYITHISIDDLISALQMAKEQQGDNV